MKRFWAYLGASVIGVLLSAWLMPTWGIDCTWWGFPFSFAYSGFETQDSLYLSGFVLDVLIFLGPNALMLYVAERWARKRGVKESVVNGVLIGIAVIALALLVYLYVGILRDNQVYSGRWQFHLGLH